jgi:hypothetical protein
MGSTAQAKANKYDNFNLFLMWNGLSKGQGARVLSEDFFEICDALVFGDCQPTISVFVTNLT